MNEVILMGRLTKDPDIRYTQEAQPMCIARYTLAVDRGVKKEGQQSADFISCVAFGKNGEFTEKYLHKGMKICLSGRIQTQDRTARRFTRRMLWWRIRNLQRARWPTTRRRTIAFHSRKSSRRIKARRSMASCIYQTGLTKNCRSTRRIRAWR